MTIHSVFVQKRERARQTGGAEDPRMS